MTVAREQLTPTITCPTRERQRDVKITVVRATESVDAKLCKIEKCAHFTHFEQKNTHISGCKIVHLCTIAIATVHICTVTVALVFIILLDFSLSCL